MEKEHITGKFATMKTFTYIYSSILPVLPDELLNERNYSRRYPLNVCLIHFQINDIHICIYMFIRMKKGIKRKIVWDNEHKRKSILKRKEAYLDREHNKAQSKFGSLSGTCKRKSWNPNSSFQFLHPSQSNWKRLWNGIFFARKKMSNWPQVKNVGLRIFFGIRLFFLGGP